MKTSSIEVKIVPHKYALALLAALLTLAVGCSSRAGEVSVLRYGLTLAPTGIDPHINASVELGIPLSSVYDMLVFQDPDSGEFVPGLAERWEVSADGLSYTFTLRQDVWFHDGQPFNAEAVQANLDYIRDPEHRSQKALAMLGSLREVRVLGEHEVELRLDSPYAPLLDSLSQVYLGMASPAALADWGPGEYQFHQVGTGPFRFIEYVPNDRLILERNPDYAWGPTIYAQSSAQIDRIEFRFYEDVATRALALESGEVDIIGELPPREALRLEAEPEFKIFPVPIPGQPLQLIFNTQRSPVDDPAVRQALIQSVDRDAVVDIVFGAFSPLASGPLSANTYGYSTRVAFPGYDLQAAAGLLEGAGWVLTDSGFRQRGEETLELKLVVPTWGSNPEVAQLLSSAWGELGAKVELEVAAGFGPLTQAQSEGEYHLIGMYSFGTDPDLLRPFYHSEGFFNWSGFRSAEMDALLEQAAQTFGSESARLEIYQQIASVVRDQVLILPVRDYVNLIGTSRAVQGLRFSPQGWFPYLIDIRLEP